MDEWIRILVQIAVVSASFSVAIVLVSRLIMLVVEFFWPSSVEDPKYVISPPPQWHPEIDPNSALPFSLDEIEQAQFMIDQLKSQK